ncbi:hypothetical protein Tdes44962_MAKER06024 [Teratosphaeria destructans]|uniref:Uncharacterized protein n=1 Tax=Teratosphaeria destructans TaxID=418781 RepID=A0A9W7SIV3_9PEZI|nr:hypothetical protein Tdes44962_MAKER06024 [Teratosphaeria destructans]
MRVTFPKPEAPVSAVLHELTPEEERDLQLRIENFKKQHGFPSDSSERKWFLKEIASARADKHSEKLRVERKAEAWKREEKYSMRPEDVKARLRKIQDRKEGKVVEEPVEAKVDDDGWVVETEGMDVPGVKAVYGGLE